MPGPQCFKAAQAPSYHGGIVAMLVSFILNIVFNIALRVLYSRENKKRDRALEGKSGVEIQALREESRVQGFENVTDKQNVSRDSECKIVRVRLIRWCRYSSGMSCKTTGKRA